MLARLQLVSCRSAVVTADLADGLRALEQRVAQVEGARLKFKGVKRAEVQTDLGEIELPQHLSLRSSGREASLVLSAKGIDPQEALATLWGLAIPCGFTPYDRYPVLNRTAGIFHFLGPWQRLYDSLLSEGRGEVAWASVCAASQVDVGTWKGDRTTERFVQAQLHRLGFPCGPVDGIIGDRTTSSIRALGMTGMSLNELARGLGQEASSKPPVASRRFGYVVAPGAISVVSTGGVAALQTPHGVTLTIDGPGRLVLDLGGLG